MATLATVQSLVSSLNGICDKYPFHIGWYLKDLRSGEAADRNGHVVVPSASTRKIAILMTALKQVNEGRLALDQPVTIQSKYQDNTSGCFQHLQPSFTIQFRDALVMMIIVSDNTCTGTVADMVGLDNVNALCQSISMKGTAHRHGMPPKGLPRNHPVEATNATTPADVGLLLDLILEGTADAGAADRLGCTSELCSLAIDILSWQKLRARLPSMLPEGTKVAHKTGTGARNFNDAGIIYQGDQPLFILTAYTENVPVELPDGTPGHTAAAQLIGRLARTSYDALRT
jgi:beta-lactamase class A